MNDSTSLCLYKKLAKLNPDTPNTNKAILFHYRYIKNNALYRRIEPYTLIKNATEDQIDFQKSCDPIGPIIFLNQKTTELIKTCSDHHHNTHRNSTLLILPNGYFKNIGQTNKKNDTYRNVITTKNTTAQKLFKDFNFQKINFFQGKYFTKINKEFEPIDTIYNKQKLSEHEKIKIKKDIQNIIHTEFSKEYDMILDNDCEIQYKTHDNTTHYCYNKNDSITNKTLFLTSIKDYYETNLTILRKINAKTNSTEELS